MTLQEIEKEVAHSLSYAERVELGYYLKEFDSLSSDSQEDVDNAWDAEISDRIKDIDEGRVELLDGPTVMREMKTIIENARV